MRFPAGAQGLFSNRPSTGAVPLDGVIPLCGDLDSAGVFARSAIIWSTVAHAWYDQYNTSFASFPTTIYYLNATFDPELINNTATSAMLESFVGKLETFLGTERTNVSVDNHWTATRPEGAPESVQDMLYVVSLVTSLGLEYLPTNLFRPMEFSSQSINGYIWVCHFSVTTQPNTMAASHTSILHPLLAGYGDNKKDAPVNTTKL